MREPSSFFTPKRLGVIAAATLLSVGLSGCAGLVVAGVAGGVAVAQDRRATSVVWNDQEIERRVAERIRARYGTDTHVNITSFNRAVLLSGEVPDDATRAEVERMARETQDVRKVHNETKVALPSTLSARASDTALTARIKARMVEANKFSPLHVKVVSERGSVFLLGLVKVQEGRDAAEVVSRTQGVDNVVTLFEYIE
ncbi:BON domain-containing protein [Chitinimonas lacunae]|uniref:BON domain-containing protein n=1 Tax=Chitinimonas lacunae TaxID=1963018 RepID=A0ABV8MNA5_9NEIS